jgi:heterodisulfide reductase subunit A
LVIGGGIAGMQAALDIANAGFTVTLVEKSPTVGGRMLQFSEVFPTLDCPQCIGTPKMLEVGAHPNIRLKAYAEILDITGNAGNFKIKIKNKSRYIDTKKCTACGECARVCPVSMPDERNLGLNQRKAAYIPFAQAVPAKYTIDKREERPCKAACKAVCPISTNVQGYLKLISSGKPKEAYELIQRTNPLPSTCGRVCYSPCETACNRGQLDEPLAIRALKRFATDQIDIDKLEVPQIKRNGKKVAIIGAGPAGLSAANDLALKGYDVTIFEALPEAGGLLRVGIPEYRLPKATLRKEIAYIERLGVQIKTNMRIGEKIRIAEIRQNFDSIFIATGAYESQKLNVPGEDTQGVIPAMKFLRDVNMGNKTEIGKKVVVIGGGNSAIDAARVARRLGSDLVKVIYRRSREEMPANKSEVRAAEAEGIEIVFLAVPTRILAENTGVSGIECIRMTLGDPDNSGRRRPIPSSGSEFAIEADTVISALGQIPDVAFTKELSIGITPKNTITVDEATLATNVSGIFAGGDVVSGPDLVITAIAAGKQAALSIDAYLKNEPLSPESAKSQPQQLNQQEISTIRNIFPANNRTPMPELEVKDRLHNFKEVELGYSTEQAINEAARCIASKMEGCFDCRECETVCDAKAIDRTLKDTIEDIEAGVIVVASGYEIFDAKLKPEYGYGLYPQVITGMELERIDEAGGPTLGKIEINGKTPKNIVFIQCVGSRDKSVGVEYCSRVCCMYTAKQALYIKSKLPDAKVTVCYIDIRAFGKGYEQFYERAQSEGVIYRRGIVSEVYRKGDKLVVRAEDTLLSETYEEEADMVVLATGLQPGKDTIELSRKLDLPVGPDGFFLEAHPKLGPIETTTDGIFLAGCCQGPKDITDSVIQASAAASLACVSLASYSTPEKLSV